MNKKYYLLISTTLLLTFVYAFLRYILLGPISIQQLPLYLLNKVFSFSGVVIIAATLLISCYKKKRNIYNKQAKRQNTLLGLSGVVLIVLHFLISILLFSKEYYPNFYNISKLTMNGGISLLFAILALTILLIAGFISFIKVFGKTKFKIKKSYLQLIKIALIFTSFHLLFMGFNSWYVIPKWNGGLPPMTLLAFLIIITVFGYRLLFGMKKKKL